MTTGRKDESKLYLRVYRDLRSADIELDLLATVEIGRLRSGVLRPDNLF
jgi:hypothetical protein